MSNFDRPLVFVLTRFYCSIHILQLKRQISYDVKYLKIPGIFHQLLCIMPEIFRYLNHN